MDPVEAVRESGGVSSGSRLARLAVPRRALQHAVDDGRLTRTGRDYTLPGSPLELMAAARHGAAVGCVSALRLHGVEVPGRREPVHLLVRSARPVRSAVVHRAPAGGLIEPVLPAAVRALRCLDRHAALAVVDSMLRRGAAELDELSVAVGSRPGPATRWVLRHADSRAESPLESQLRAVLIDAGIPGIDLQVAIAGVGRVDMVIGGWLVVEADGFENHSDRDAYRNDRRRLDAQLAAGLVTLWFSFEDVTGDPARVAQTVLDVIERRRRGAFRLVTSSRAVQDRQRGRPTAASRR
jgi:very-short-patch-repair endonuclease